MAEDSAVNEQAISPETTAEDKVQAEKSSSDSSEGAVTTESLGDFVVDNDKKAEVSREENGVLETSADEDNEPTVKFSDKKIDLEQEQPSFDASSVLDEKQETPNGGPNLELEKKGDQNPELEAEFEEPELVPSSPDQEVLHAGLVPIRAVVSEDVEDDDEDGEASFGSAGSGDSFDSALERIAESSAASNDAVSPKGMQSGKVFVQSEASDANEANFSVDPQKDSLDNGDVSEDNKVEAVKEVELDNDEVASNEDEFSDGQDQEQEPEDVEVTGDSDLLHAGLMPIRAVVSDDVDQPVEESNESIDETLNDVDKVKGTDLVEENAVVDNGDIEPEQVGFVNAQQSDFEDENELHSGLLPIRAVASDDAGQESSVLSRMNVDEGQPKEGESILVEAGQVDARSFPEVVDDDTKDAVEIASAETIPLEKAPESVELKEQTLAQLAEPESEFKTFEEQASDDAKDANAPLMPEAEAKGELNVEKQPLSLEVEDVVEATTPTPNEQVAEATPIEPEVDTVIYETKDLDHVDYNDEKLEQEKPELETKTMDVSEKDESVSHDGTTALALESISPEAALSKQELEVNGGQEEDEDEEELFESDVLLELRQLKSELREAQSAQAAVSDARKTLSPIRALVADDTEDAGDGETSIGSEESFDTALEKIVAASAASNDAMAKPAGPTLGASGPSLPARPTPISRAMPSLEPGSRLVQQSPSGGTTASQSPAAANSQSNSEPSDGNEDTREKLQQIRVRFLRLANRLGQSAHNVVVAQVLYRLGLAEQLRGGRGSRNSAFSFDRASAIAEEQEAAGQEELDFACTIMLLGKTGVGKSATINSIFDETKTETNAFSWGTKKVQEITGTVHGIKLRVIDTPGLLPSVSDQRQNEKMMSSVKRFIKRSPPDIVLYFDRLDMQSRDYGDLPLLRTITDTFGPQIWFNAIVVLTHASSAPPDGPNGVPLSYEMFVAQRSHIVQQTIRQAAGDMRLMNPVSLVENHPACRTNRNGERVLPNGQLWKPQLLLLCFASKILAEANSLLKLQESSPGKPFGTRSKVPPLPFLLSSLLQSRAQLKLPEEPIGDEDESDEDMDDEDDSDAEAEYDELPPFRRLTKEEINQLNKQNKKAYFEELELREKLFQKKQWKEELKRRKEMRKRMGSAKNEDIQSVDDGYDDENARSAAVPVPLPDMALPLTFDSDSPTHRYRYLDTANQWLVRPVLETHGWDHDSGYDGLNLEKMFVIKSKVPASVSGQITKDKKETNLTMECAASVKHGEGKVTLTGFDVQTIGKDFSYTLRSETRFSNFKRNKTTAGLALTKLGETFAGGMKIEDRLVVGKRLKIVSNAGALTGKGDMAYGGTLEVTLRDEDFPIGRNVSTLGFSVMKWHGDLAIGGNAQSQFSIGKTTMTARANLNNRGSGQISIRTSSSEQLQLALIGIIPLVRALIANRLFGFLQPTQ